MTIVIIASVLRKACVRSVKKQEQRAGHKAFLRTMRD